MGFHGRPEAAIEGFREYLEEKRNGRDEPLYDMDDRQMSPVFDGVYDQAAISAAVRNEGEEAMGPARPRSNSVVSAVVSLVAPGFRRASLAPLIQPPAVSASAGLPGTSIIAAGRDNEQNAFDVVDDIDLDAFLPRVNSVGLASGDRFASDLEAVFRRRCIDTAVLAVVSPRPLSTDSGSDMDHAVPLESEQYDGVGDLLLLLSLRMLV